MTFCRSPRRRLSSWSGSRLRERLADLPDPPYIRTGQLGGQARELVFTWHPAAFQGPKTIGALYGPQELARLKELATSSHPRLRQTC
jgi:hypothetical protein